MQESIDLSSERDEEGASLSLGMEFIGNLLSNIGLMELHYHGYVHDIRMDIIVNNDNGINISIYNNEDKDITTITDEYKVTMTPNLGITIINQEYKEGINDIKEIVIEDNSIFKLFKEISSWLNSLEINSLREKMSSDI